MRVCAYYPVAIVDFDENGYILDEAIEDGFEDNFIDMITYVGEMNTEDNEAYSINVPTIPEVSRTRIIDRLSDIKESLRIKHSSYDN